MIRRFSSLAPLLLSSLMAAQSVRASGANKTERTEHEQSPASSVKPRAANSRPVTAQQESPPGSTFDFKASGLAWTLPDGVRVLLSSHPELNKRKMLTLNLQWQGQSTWEPLSFDAEMPEHKHGMVVAASKPQRQGSREPVYRVEGVKLHMAGLWLLKLEIRNKTTGETRWIQIPFHLKI